MRGVVSFLLLALAVSTSATFLDTKRRFVGRLAEVRGDFWQDLLDQLLILLDDIVNALEDASDELLQDLLAQLEQLLLQLAALGGVAWADLMDILNDYWDLLGPLLGDLLGNLGILPFRHRHHGAASSHHDFRMEVRHAAIHGFVLRLREMKGDFWQDLLDQILILLYYLMEGFEDFSEDVLQDILALLEQLLLQLAAFGGETWADLMDFLSENWDLLGPLLGDFLADLGIFPFGHHHS
ncbi:unnamed protein product [Darwinula stevensoni]|uniref:Uncharacterized protein n=1 Tax=Darwinula stevensoni TaxID=69355 RepID=A0A7R8XBB2_9CRUS|nr:unnamed protein product [Darwinula stevensoni]CAG0890871.1 unnamed protein product [Darwinula stevensoni]